MIILIIMVLKHIYVNIYLYSQIVAVQPESIDCVQEKNTVNGLQLKVNKLYQSMHQDAVNTRHLFCLMEYFRIKN